MCVIYSIYIQCIPIVFKVCHFPSMKWKIASKITVKLVNPAYAWRKLDVLVPKIVLVVTRFRKLRFCAERQKR